MYTHSLVISYKIKLDFLSSKAQHIQNTRNQVGIIGYGTKQGDCLRLLVSFLVTSSETV